jgi:hypothetical protein
LIASPWGNLTGPENDVDSVGMQLRYRNFEIIRCSGGEATRSKILHAWEQLVTRLQTESQDTTKPEPAVVIYYSGHGGLIQHDQCEHDKDNEECLRDYQFIVPMDFDPDAEDFTGILDVEISHLLRQTTAITSNVTVILDCCHAGRMARDPLHPDAIPKAIPPMSHKALTQHMRNLRKTSEIDVDIHQNDNPLAVRVAAAATTEAAYEFHDETGLRVGVLTKYLVKILKDTMEARLSWRTVMLRLLELVNSEFPQQHPHVEGPLNRLLFSTELSDSRCHTVLTENGKPYLRAGRLAGVKEGNVYIVMPFGYERPEKDSLLCRATVTHIDGLRSFVELDPAQTQLPYEGALAFLEFNALYRWAAEYPQDEPGLQRLLQSSRYLRPRSEEDLDEPFVRIEKRDGAFLVKNLVGTVIEAVDCSDHDNSLATKRIIKSAETLARGHHLLTLERGTGPESFEHQLEITVLRVDGELDQELPMDGRASLEEDDRIFVSLYNSGYQKVWLSVFDVSPTGEVGPMSIHQGETGIPIGAGCRANIGKAGVGLKITWPRSVPRPTSGSILGETLVFIITNRPVDLRHLQKGNERNCQFERNRTHLEFLTRRLASGIGRPVEMDAGDSGFEYDVVRFSFSLKPGNS